MTFGALDSESAAHVMLLLLRFPAAVLVFSENADLVVVGVAAAMVPAGSVMRGGRWFK